MDKTFIARKDPEGKTQSVWEHAQNVAHISALESHYPITSKLIAYLHDLGKLSDDFQNYIVDGGKRGSVIHAWQGAFYVNELFTDHTVTDTLLKEIIGFCISAHHNHLSDGVSPDGSTDHYDKFSNTMDTKYSFANIKAKINQDDAIRIQQLFEAAKDEIGALLTEIKENYKISNSANFALGLFVKYLYSCLVDADRLDAYLFNTKEEYKEKITDWNTLINTYESNISKYPNGKEIDRIRKSVSDKCKTAAHRATGIYQLSVPTGGGKTLSSLRFALHHCKEHGKKRIIYVIPYLSIIEQTAKNIRKILDLTNENDEVVFEHHSNIMEKEDEDDKDNKKAEIRALTATRWDSPIIITTLVQFLETAMSAKAGKLRKFAHMADSVIIFDEIQSIPIKTIHCFNEVVSFLSKILNSTVILCSATQPTLESTQRTNLLMSGTPKLIDCTDDFKDIKRVNVAIESEKDSLSAAEFILDKADDNGNCLVIVNTKKSALQLYNLLRNQNPDFKIVHLSTSMCPIHRMKVIETVKECLNERVKVICVSTQLIEAGVDLSFSCVIRAMAGLDSIAQAAGRCNRNGESSELKTVYTFQLRDENLDKLPDIKSGKEITVQIAFEKTVNTDLLDESVMTRFYQEYFKGKDKQMDYPISNNEYIYQMLSNHDYGRGNYFNKTGKKFSHMISQAFLSASMNFCVIEDNTKSVVVMYEESEELIRLYRAQPVHLITKLKVQIIKKLQRFSVALYDWQLQKLSQKKALTILDEETGILILDKNYYDKGGVGVVTDIIQDNLII